MKAAEQLARTIALTIFEGGVEVGSPLSREAEMAHEYGVGRSTVREALRMLESWGAVEMRQGRHGGPVARRPDAGSLGDHLGIVMQFEHVTIANLFETRRVLDTLLTRLAAQSMSDAELLDLGQAVQGMAHSIHDRDAYYLHSDRFYEVLAAASRNPALRLLIRSLMWVTTELIYRVADPEEWRRISVRMRQAVFRAIAAGDPDAAADTMDDYRRTLSEWWTTRYPEQMSRPIDVLSEGPESAVRRSDSPADSPKHRAGPPTPGAPTTGDRHAVQGT